MVGLLRNSQSIVNVFMVQAEAHVGRPVALFEDVRHAVDYAEMLVETGAESDTWVSNWNVLVGEPKDANYSNGGPIGVYFSKK